MAKQTKQGILRELASALDSMPSKKLIADALADELTGSRCSIGALCDARGIDPFAMMKGADAFSKQLGMPPGLYLTIVNANDDPSATHKTLSPSGKVSVRMETPAERWTRMRAWVASQIRAKP